jgi:hypothetical protein
MRYFYKSPDSDWTECTAFGYAAALAAKDAAERSGISGWEVKQESGDIQVADADQGFKPKLYRKLRRLHANDMHADVVAHDPEYREANRKHGGRTSRAVICVDEAQTCTRYRNCQVAADALGMSRISVRRAALRQKPCRGLRFMFADQESAQEQIATSTVNGLTTTNGLSEGSPQ